MVPSTSLVTFIDRYLTWPGRTSLRRGAKLAYVPSVSPRPRCMRHDCLPALQLRSVTTFVVLMSVEPAGQTILSSLPQSPPRHHKLNMDAPTSRLILRVSPRFRLSTELDKGRPEDCGFLRCHFPAESLLLFLSNYEGTSFAFRRSLPCWITSLFLSIRCQFFLGSLAFVRRLFSPLTVS